MLVVHSTYYMSATAGGSGMLPAYGEYDPPDTDSKITLFQDARCPTGQNCIASRKLPSITCSKSRATAWTRCSLQIPFSSSLTQRDCRSLMSQIATVPNVSFAYILYTCRRMCGNAITLGTWTSPSRNFLYGFWPPISVMRILRHRSICERNETASGES